MKRSKYENTVVVSLRQAWYIEEIQQLIRIDTLTIHYIAKRNGLQARHAPRGYMRRKKIAVEVQQYGIETTVLKYQLSVKTVRKYANQAASQVRS